MDGCVLCVLPCEGIGFARGLSPIQGVLINVTFRNPESGRLRAALVFCATQEEYACSNTNLCETALFVKILYFYLCLQPVKEKYDENV
jgi:hypothetical protein